jgi:asparagine synthetase B (glutamine-hydrolysing)
MCGIAGLVGDFIPGLMNRMNSLQAHRRPDGQEFLGWYLNSKRFKAEKLNV